ncbi:hypothetical protein BIW11_13937 [Tropilaelaps mercedesae]|uniref:Uncharacterized protein n=1 Tax=Tropilaelaps mercedesae TaxID=418985 RepID=A0A1V9WZU0_9ACAR|nr:hypothetical protein BIW11_13937 [Tropilaelaps mercedesae]
MYNNNYDYRHGLLILPISSHSYASNDDCTRNFDRFTKTVRQLYGSCFCFHCESRKNLTDNRNISETERITMEEKDSEREKYYEYGTLSSPLSGLVIQLNTEINVIEPAVEMSQYRRAMCLEYCEIEYLIYKCKCIKNYSGVKVHPDLVEDYKYCKTPRKSKCAKDTLEGKNNLFWQARCDCRRECETQRYATDVSVAGFIAEDATRNISGENHIEELMAEMSTARLVVYFHSFTYEHVKAIKKYDGIRVLSNIGGINGMYLGLSFYLLFQVNVVC